MISIPKPLRLKFPHTYFEGTLECGDPTTRLCAFVTPQMATRKLARVYGGGTLGEQACADFHDFDQAQVDAIVAYLWWKLETERYNPTIEQALENYWLERQQGLCGAST